MKRRKYIPIAVRVAVVSRQLLTRGITPPRPGNLPSLLRTFAIVIECEPTKLELHHRPALVNRPLNKRKTDTVPPANDPDFLFFVPKAEHKIETYVRGLGAQHSDMAQRRIAKRRARKKAGPVAHRNKSRNKSRGKMRSANRWPAKGSRKLNWRKPR